jgi:hypothetical protein
MMKNFLSLRPLFWFPLAGVSLACCQSAKAAPANTVNFFAPPLQQAKILLRKVEPFGNVRPEPLPSLPVPLDGLMAYPTTGVPSTGAVLAFLEQQKINPADVGDVLPFGDPIPCVVRYFVIHDTSTPNYKEGEFPPTINTPEWPLNRLQERWSTFTKTHAFTNRVGDSLTLRDFNQPLSSSATKWEVIDPAARRPAFIHIENTQPRRSLPKGNPGNDAQAPTPGFPDAQYDRLALLYVYASARRGQWLIPAFHATIDEGIANAHDDPQNFDLSRWCGAISKLRLQIFRAQNPHDR